MILRLPNYTLMGPQLSWASYDQSPVTRLQRSVVVTPTLMLWDELNKVIKPTLLNQSHENLWLVKFTAVVSPSKTEMANRPDQHHQRKIHACSYSCHAVPRLPCSYCAVSKKKKYINLFFSNFFKRACLTFFKLIGSIYLHEILVHKKFLIVNSKIM